MFKVGNLKIRFKHETKHLSQRDGKECYEGTGRFGVTCFIYQEGVEEAIYTGHVLIHKGDQVDRILGKKYALRKALLESTCPYINTARGHEVVYVWWMSKRERTKIWKAFWAWVKSWDKKSYPTLLEACLTVQNYNKAGLEDKIPQDEICDYWDSVMSIVDKAVQHEKDKT